MGGGWGVGGILLVRSNISDYLYPTCMLLLEVKLIDPTESPGRCTYRRAKTNREYP